MAILESTLGGGKFSASSSNTIGNGVSTCNNPCAPSKDYSTIARNGSWDNAHRSDPSNRGKRLGGDQVLWCNAHNVQVGVQMAKLATL